MAMAGDVIDVAAHFLLSLSDEALPIDVQDDLIRAGLELVYLEPSIEDTLKEVAASLQLQYPKDLDAPTLCAFLRSLSPLPPRLAEASVVRQLAHFVVDDARQSFRSDLSMLQGVPLLLLEDGSLRAFKRILDGELQESTSSEEEEKKVEHEDSEDEDDEVDEVDEVDDEDESDENGDDGAEKHEDDEFARADPRIPPGGSIAADGTILDASSNPVLGPDGKLLRADPPVELPAEDSGQFDEFLCNETIDRKRLLDIFHDLRSDSNERAACLTRVKRRYSSCGDREQSQLDALMKKLKRCEVLERMATQVKLTFENGHVRDDGMRMAPMSCAALLL